MPRRKRQLLDDDESDSSAASENGDFEVQSNDPDTQEERALFENPYRHKKRRRNGKEDALYGVFGKDSEDEGHSGGPRRGQKGGNDWTKAPAFVSGEKVNLKESVDGEDDGEGDVESVIESDDDEGTSGGENENELHESGSSRPPSPRIREEEDDESPTRIGGLGSRAEPRLTEISSGVLKGGTGIGFKRDNDSSIHPPVRSSAPSPSPAAPEFPSAFSSVHTQRSFIRDTRNTPPSNRPATPLSAAEQAHFNKLQGTFGARMLAKMGWQAGTGLGTTGEGIVTPVDQKQRPQKIGIAYKGFKEKTEQSKAEARRRGEVVSDDEGERRTKRGAKKAEKEQENRSDVWKRPKKVKTKVEHKTYEQIVAEAGQETSSAGIGVIIDATGATPREVSSLAEVSLSSWTPSTDPTRIPEVRHNLRLIADACKTDLDGLAREAKALEERKKWLINEDARLRKKVEDEADLISRLQQVHLVIDDINMQAKELASVYEATLEPFSPLFYKLLEQFSREFDRYRLDEIVVAAIAPLVRRMVVQWKPLDDPTAFVSTFRNWRKALKLTPNGEMPQQSQVAVYGEANLSSVQVEKPMTPFESLLWNVWLPRVRTCINNDWSSRDAQPAVRLYEAWSGFLPPFIRDNILDQLILPKVQKAIAEWNPRKDTVPLQALVFPWLPYVGLRLDDVVGDAKRKVKSLLRAWVVGEAIPMDLITWKDVFDPGEWDAMLLKYVVPKLGATLRTDFRINPRDQKMEPLQQILLWSSILRPSIFSQILEAEFFPKWLDVLHIWLVQPRVNFEEVAQWYAFWKGTFPEPVQNMAGVSDGLTRGLQLMNKALELGPDAPARLPRPDHKLEKAATSTSARASPKTRPSARTHEITFRSIVEEFAASHNLLFMPVGRAHEKSRMQLFRVSPTADGKGGLLVYILDDAVWAPGDGDDYQAITLDDMVSKASL